MAYYINIHNPGNYNVIISLGNNGENAPINIIASEAVVQDFNLSPECFDAIISEDNTNKVHLCAKFSQISVLTNTTSFYSLIDWGDNTLSIGNIDSLSQLTSSHEWYRVTDCHTYPLCGVNTTYNINVLVIDVYNKTTIITGEVTIPAVASSALSIQLSPNIISNKNLSLLVTFIDLSGFRLPATNYNATVNFGDGNNGHGLVSQIGNTSQYIVTITHKYKHRNTYNLTLMINNVPIISKVTIK